MIRRDRDGYEAPHSTIKTVVTSLVQTNSFTDQPLQLYIEEFERPYLVHTKRYFEAEAAREMASGNVSSFMKKATERLRQEIMRNNRYCHSTSHRRIVKEFEAQYIAAYNDRIIEEFPNMLQEERFDGNANPFNLNQADATQLLHLLRLHGSLQPTQPYTGRSSTNFDHLRRVHHKVGQRYSRQAWKQPSKNSTCICGSTPRTTQQILQYQPASILS